MLLPLSKIRTNKSDIFEPLDRTMSAAAQFEMKIPQNIIDSYSYANLESIYC